MIHETNLLNVSHWLPDETRHVAEGLVFAEEFGVLHVLRQILHGRFGQQEADEAAEDGQPAEDDVGKGGVVRALRQPNIISGGKHWPGRRPTLCTDPIQPLRQSETWDMSPTWP